jgi:hypothetical protein
MIGGICESPLTIRALLAWRAALWESKILLRDIIDLNATYDSDPSEAEMAEAVAELEEPEGEKGSKLDGKSTDKIAAEHSAKTGAKQDSEDDSEDETSDEGEADEDEEAGLSLTAIEQALLPQVECWSCRCGWGWGWCRRGPGGGGWAIMQAVHRRANARDSGRSDLSRRLNPKRFMWHPPGKGSLRWRAGSRRLRSTSEGPPRPG